MEALSLVLIDTSTFLDKYAHGGHSGYEVTFGTIPNTLQFMYYPICNL